MIRALLVVPPVPAGLGGGFRADDKTSYPAWVTAINGGVPA